MATELNEKIYTLISDPAKTDKATQYLREKWEQGFRYQENPSYVPEKPKVDKSNWTELDHKLHANDNSTCTCQDLARAAKLRNPKFVLKQV